MRMTVSQRILQSLNYNLQLKDRKTETTEDDVRVLLERR